MASWGLLGDDTTEESCLALLRSFQAVRREERQAIVAWITEHWADWTIDQIEKGEHVAGGGS